MRPPLVPLDRGLGTLAVLTACVVLAILDASEAQGHFVGTPCVHRESGEEGRCELLSRCSPAMRELRRGGRPQVCGFQDGRVMVPNVCCPGPAPREWERPAPDPADCGSRSYPTPPAEHCKDVLARPQDDDDDDDDGPGSTARKACRAYARDTCVQKLLPPKAVSPSSGEAADKMEFPHMALLGYGEDSNDIDYACGGSLISRDFILTAAHCRALRSKPVRWALLGALSRHSGRTLDSDQQLIRVQDVISHPEYNPRQRYHDIALLLLERPAELSLEGVRPACLHTEEDGDPTDLEAIATGWGATGYAEDVSENLLKVNLTVRHLDYCRRKIRASADPKLPKGIVDTQLCAGGGSERDTCQGDSGGPLQVAAVLPTPMQPAVCVYRIVGVVSFGPACGIGLPGVYTRVAAYSSWIESIVWPTKGDSCTPYNPLLETASDEVNVPNTGPGTVTRRMCRSFLKDWCLAGGVMQPGLQRRDQCHYDLGDRQADLVDVDRYPHMAMLSYGNSPYNEETGCAASLIHPQYVLTTAHCTKLGCLPVREVILGLLGGRSMMRASVSSNVQQRIAVERVVVHPEYEPRQRRNDVALLRLAAPAKLSQLVRPACLHTGRDGPEAGLRAIATGWDATGHWQDVKGDLREVVLPVRSRAACEEAARRRGYEMGLQASQLCAGGLCVNDTYPGDIGSPLQVLFRVVDKARLYRIVGLVSGSPPCGSLLPDVYSRVSHFVPWIESVVWPSS